MPDIPPCPVCGKEEWHEEDKDFWLCEQQAIEELLLEVEEKESKDEL